MCIVLTTRKIISRNLQGNSDLKQLPLILFGEVSMGTVLSPALSCAPPASSAYIDALNQATPAGQTCAIVSSLLAAMAHFVLSVIKKIISLCWLPRLENVHSLAWGGSSVCADMNHSLYEIYCIFCTHTFVSQRYIHISENVYTA